jgi:hypothetical protein
LALSLIPFAMIHLSAVLLAASRMFPRTWDLDFIALPAINKREQNTPTLEATQIEDILSGSRGKYRVLYALLAGSGMRISEALGLEIGKHLEADCSVIYVRQQRSKKGHRIETYPKTDSGIRDVDLPPKLSALLKDYVAKCTSRFLFETPAGLPMAPRNILRDSLHPLLKKMGCGSAGFHTFRRFREAVLQMSNARNLLIDFWMGHAKSENGWPLRKAFAKTPQGHKSRPVAMVEARPTCYSFQTYSGLWRGTGRHRRLWSEFCSRELPSSILDACGLRDSSGHIRRAKRFRGRSFTAIT